MILELIPALRNKLVILASSSPQRREIFGNLGLPFKVVVSNFPEDLDKDNYQNQPEKFAIDTAAGKADEVVKQLGQEPFDLLVSADTVVHLHARFFEKPTDSAEAAKFLKTFNEQTVSVITGVVILQKLSGKINKFEFFEKTSVNFGTLSESLINWYVATGEPIGKAGGFAIQGKGALLIKGIDGDFNNVIGFPLHRFVSELRRIYS